MFNSPKNLKLHFWDDLKEHFVRKINANPEFPVFQDADFQNRKNFGEKIEKSKIASNNFKQLPWATQSPNMSFQLPLGPKIIAAPC